jgi:hypothetical protein
VGITCLLPRATLIGMRRSMPARTAAGSEMASRFSGVLTAIMPHPISTPPAAGMIAAFAQ